MRPFNFSPGPATLPDDVLRQAAEEMLDWRGSGVSVMEMSHRGKHFESILAEALDDLRGLLQVPQNYRILLMQGGALAENAIVPLNLLRGQQPPDYAITGSWSIKSYTESLRYDAGSRAVVNTKEGGFRSVPPVAGWDLSPQAAYLHVCTNETVNGVEFAELPATPAGVPLVIDASSHFLSRPLDVAKCGVVYAGAQKNAGIAGLTFVIVRDDLLDRALPICPSAFEWDTVAANNSMFNTPPTYAIYIAGLVLKWLKAQGGLAAIEQCNIAKAQLLYDTIDASSLYRNQVDKPVRSRMNVPFWLVDETLNAAFLAGAEQHRLLQLKGHKSVGGMRASIYNAMPIEGVRALVAYMTEFERTHA